MVLVLLNYIRFGKKNQLTNKSPIPNVIKECKYPVILFDNSAEGHCDELMFKFIITVVPLYELNPNTTFMVIVL